MPCVHFPFPGSISTYHKHISYVRVNTGSGTVYVAPWANSRTWSLLASNWTQHWNSRTWDKCTLWDDRKTTGLTSAFSCCCVGASPASAGNAVQGCSGERRWRQVIGACVPPCVCQRGQACAWTCSLQKSKTKKINLLPTFTFSLEAHAPRLR